MRFELTTTDLEGRGTTSCATESESHSCQNVKRSIFVIYSSMLFSLITGLCKISLGIICIIFTEIIKLLVILDIKLLNFELY